MTISATAAQHVKVRDGISACLLGERVRYDGNHNHDAYITGTLAKVFEFVAVCPEVAIGMGVPRPPIQLVGEAAQPRAIGVGDPALDVPAALTAYGRRMAVALDDISGYIFNAKSPSCGLLRVKVFQSGAASPRGVGLYAREIAQRQPMIPEEEEGRLDDPVLREEILAQHR